MRILWVVPKWTLPATDGARVATDSLVRNTVKAGAKVDVLCLAEEHELCSVEEMQKTWGVEQVHVIRRKSRGSGVRKYISYGKDFIRTPGTPLTFTSFYGDQIRKSLQLLLETQSYDRLLLDGLHLGASFMNTQGNLSFPNVKAVVYRAHNIETDLWRKAQLSCSNGLKRLVLKQQAKLVEAFEHNILSHVDAVAPIAIEDMEFIQKRYPRSLVRHIPLGMNFHGLPPSEASAVTRFLFIGRLDWAPNRDGLEWVLREIWPEVIRRNNNVRLKIVGTGDGRWVSKYTHLPGIEFKGFMRNLEDAYRDAHFTIVPITFGSGTRIKVIESFVMNRRLISTEAGVQGAELRASDYIQAESKDDWIKILSEIRWEPKHQFDLDRARDYVGERFCEQRIGQEFYDWMRTLS